MTEPKSSHAHSLAVHGGGPAPRHAEADLIEVPSFVVEDDISLVIAVPAWRLAETHGMQLAAAFSRIAPTNEILEQFNAMYRRRQAIARLEESDGEPYSESSLHEAFEWLLSNPLYPVHAQDERVSLDDKAWDAMRDALATVDSDLAAEFFTRARQAGFDPGDTPALTEALQIAMLRYVERGTSDQLA